MMEMRMAAARAIQAALRSKGGRAEDSQGESAPLPPDPQVEAPPVEASSSTPPAKRPAPPKEAPPSRSDGRTRRAQRQNVPKGASHREQKPPTGFSSSSARQPALR